MADPEIRKVCGGEDVDLSHMVPKYCNVDRSEKHRAHTVAKKHPEGELCYDRLVDAVCHNEYSTDDKCPYDEVES